MRRGIILFIAAAWFAAAVNAQAGGGGACVTGSCHQGLLEAKYVHGPVAVQDCLFCHKQAEGHKFKLVAAVPELCRICHDAEKLVRNVDCVKCHDPHGSPLEFQLLPGAGKICKGR